MTTEIRREISNPHDKMTIDYSDPEAAQLAVLVVGGGRYGIIGDDGMPIFLFGGVAEWVDENYGVTPDEWWMIVGKPRIAKALRSWRLEGERSSISDPTGNAHEIATGIEAELYREQETP